MTLHVIVFAASLSVVWLIWKVFRPYFTKSLLDNIPGPTPQSLLMGDMGPLYDRCEGWDYARMLREQYQSVVRIKGLLGHNALFISDPMALHHVLSQDGVLFNFSESMQATANITLGPGLASVRGPQHRKQRKMLNPVFSTDSMRGLTPLFYEIANKLHDVVYSWAEAGRHEIDIMRFLSNAALEFISDAGMGHSFDLIKPDADIQSLHPMAHAVKNFTPLQTELALWWLIAAHAQRLGPPWFRRRLADLACIVLPNKNLGRMRDVVNTMDRYSRQIFRKRTEEVDGEATTKVQSGDETKNMLSILLRANRQSSAGNTLSDDELLGQMTTLIFAGGDTSSGALGRVLHLLAIHQDVQTKLREELDAARDYTGQNFDYDRLAELPYLEAVCSETLRLYTPVNILPRETLQDTVLPLQNPITGLDGKEIRAVPITRGTLVLPGYWACNTSKDLWGDDALEWKPERWLRPLPDAVLKARIPGVYSNLMSFGGGPRACIGFRFAQLEIKVVLATLLKSFKFSLTEKDIIWNWSTMPYPTMDRDTTEPSMVLRVELVQLPEPK